MKTEKLYDRDAYLSRFSATVLSCEETDGGFSVILDQTAFFPEEGGQTADGGTLGGAKVLAVKEKSGVIVHTVSSPLSVGESVEGILDFGPRFEKMQCHTAEHIVSGILHREYGIENVGFHLGSDFVTIDTSAPVTEAMLDETLAAANRAIYENLTVDCRYPAPEVLKTLSYRSKLDLTENVRIVTVPGYDVCACCAPHVRMTGEIGRILFIGAEKHKAGTRITMLAGIRAERYTSSLLSSAHSAAVALSVGNTEVGDAVASLLSERNALKGEVASLRRAMAALRAETFVPEGRNAVAVLKDASADEMLAFANAAVSKVEVLLLVLTGNEPEFRFLLMKKEGEIREDVVRMNAALSGRGGGRGNTAQGTLKAPLSEIRNYFA